MFIYLDNVKHDWKKYFLINALLYAMGKINKEHSFHINALLCAMCKMN